MNSRERVLVAIKNEPPDRCPVDFGGTQFSCCEPETLHHMREILGFDVPDDRDPDGTWPDDQIMDYLGSDLRWVSREIPFAVMKELYPKEYEKHLAKKKKDVSVNTDKPHYDFHAPLKDATLEELQKIEPEKPPIFPFIDWQKKLAQTYRERGFATTLSVGAGFFERGCWSRGYEQIAVDLLLEPDIIKCLFDRWLEESLHAVETKVKPMAHLVDIFCFGDDLGIQTGPFMSLDTYRTMVKPYMAELYKAVHDAAPNSYLFHHSCGSVISMLDDFVEIGIDILNPIQPKAAGMTPEALKEKSAERICFHGGMDLQELLPNGTPEAVREEAFRRQRTLGSGGGYICAPAHIVPADCPAENILAIYG